MKKQLVIFVFTILPFFTLAQSASISNNVFKNPNDSTRLHTWWHWVQGNITTTGITKDLEAMHKNGIVQATILNVGLLYNAYPIPKKVIFDSPDWYNMFTWALKEAKRLNIKIGVHNCDGWSSSGGPWVKPQQSMKVFTFSKTTLSGGVKINTILKKPFARENYYEDVLTFAVPSKNNVSKFQQSNPVFTLNDTLIVNGLADGSTTGGPNLNPGDVLQIKLDKPIAVNKIVIQANKPFTLYNTTKIKAVYQLYYSNNGIDYKKLDTINVAGVNKMYQFNIKNAFAQYFKLEFINFPKFDIWTPYYLTELELLNDSEKPLLNINIPFLLEKSVNAKGNFVEDYETQNDNKLLPLAKNEIINLTSFVNKNGFLTWDAPTGNWDIIRFGYTTNGAKNSPATKEGEGLECDKLDSNAVNFHFKQFPQKIIDAAGNFKGNTFKFLLIDSWECGFQNWTQNLPKEFEKQHGYSIDNFIPVLCGQIVTDNATSEAFLYDYRTTIANLTEENYYKQMAKLCHKSGIEMHAEVIYGNQGYPPLDVLKSNQYADMPMFEFWTTTNDTTRLKNFTKNKEIEFTASAALFYHKKTLAAEAYTSISDYSETPKDLKPFGDRAYCTGINQLILHTNVHQPTDTIAGLTLGIFGANFNRLTPWYKYAKTWSDYHARIQQMLQKGQMQADILYYVGDQLPQFVATTTTSTSLPTGYQMHICNYDILRNKLEVKNRKLVFGNVKFSILTLPQNMGMHLETLQQIAKLVNQGMVLFGPKPTNPLSMVGVNRNNNAYKALIKLLWGNINGKNITHHNFGKGSVYWGQSLKNVLEIINIKPDFVANPKDSLAFLYTHRVMANQDIYFVFNQTNANLSSTLNFKSKWPNLTELDPINGSTKTISNKKIVNNHTLFNTNFTPYQSKIYVFSNRKVKQTNLNSISKSTNLSIKNFKATLNFNTQGYDTIAPIILDSLKSFTTFNNTQIKYFAGYANYTISFNVNDFEIKENQKIYLNVGEIGGTASVSINGQDLGTVWCVDNKLDITNKLKTQNILTVTVGNEYRNRIIGDLIEYGAIKNIRTPYETRGFLNSKMPLKPAGLLGPLTITIQ